MKSPFPGMDPYLEQRWSDVHLKLIAFIGEAIQVALPSSLRARTEERILLENVEEEDEEQRELLASYRSDIAIVQTGPRDRPETITDGATALAEPVVIQFDPEPAVERFVQIIDVTSGNRVVTAIEVLSPWNKASGRLNTDYCRKLKDYQRGKVSVVEIDLLRYPPRGHLAVTELDLPVHRRTPYVVCIRRAWDPARWYAYPLELRRPLPKIPIPLRKKDREVPLDLQPLIDRVYTAGGHDDIDYNKPLNTPLTEQDAKWADELLRAAGRRK
jgi:hypothetical protein